MVTLEGPLEPRRLGWIAELYGRADPKYRRPEILDHLFARGPAGPSLHAFALDGGRAVGHCAVIPQRARHGTDELRCGKLEALFVEESHRGRRAGEEPLVRALLARLYAFADERELALVHALVTPRVGRITGFTPLAGVGERTFVAVMRPRRLAVAELRSPRNALADMQAAVRGVAYALARAAARGQAEVTLRPPAAEDVDLAEGPPPPQGRWTLVAGEAWDWYRASPLLRVLQIAGPHGCRALIQVPGAAHEPLRLIGWRPVRTGLLPALLLIGAAGRVARGGGAATLRFQPWASRAGDGALGRACRQLGFVPRSDLTTLWVRCHDPELARPEAVVATPLFYLAF